MDMNFKDSCIIYSANKVLAYRLREKSKEYGMLPESVDDLNNLFRMLIKDKFKLVIADVSLYYRYNDIMIEYIKDISKGYIIYVGDNYNEINCKHSNVFSCKLEDLDEILVMLNDLKFSKVGFTDKVPQELVYKYVTESLLEFKFSPTLQGYSYIKQCIISGMKIDTAHINLTRDIYKEVAMINHTSIANVEKSIRTAIRKTQQIYPEVFDRDGLSHKKVTNATFINYCIIDVKLRFINNNFDRFN